MPTLFYLVRHAAKEKGIGDVALSPYGLQQAEATAQYLCRRHIHRVISSPLRRAKQTASAIARAAGTPLWEDERLRERANWGDLPGQTFEDFVAMWDRCTQEADYIPPVGDSARQAGERLRSCLLELAAAHEGEQLALVTHGGLITDFLVQAIPEAMLNKHQDQFIARQSGLVAECSITQVSYEEGQFKLLHFAEIVY